MLDLAPRNSLAANRFPPIPFVDPPPRRLTEVEKRIILLALAARPPLLPTDWPDLTPLLEAVEPPKTDDEESAA